MISAPAEIITVEEREQQKEDVKIKVSTGTLFLNFSH